MEEEDDGEAEEEEEKGAEYWECECDQGMALLRDIEAAAVRCWSTGMWRAFLRENCGVSETNVADCDEEKGTGEGEVDDQLAMGAMDGPAGCEKGLVIGDERRDAAFSAGCNAVESSAMACRRKRLLGDGERPTRRTAFDCCGAAVNQPLTCMPATHCAQGDAE